MQLFPDRALRSVSVKRGVIGSKDAKEGSSLVPAYLYLHGVLLAEGHSDLELGLFINVHCRRWLGSSRKD